MTEVVLTGLGALCRLGGGVESFHRGLLEPLRPAPTATSDPLAHVPVPTFYFIPPEAVTAAVTTNGGSAVGHATRCALTAAREAVADAGPIGVVPERTAVLLDSTVADAQVIEEWRGSTSWPGDGRWTPTFATASAVAQALGTGGQASSLSNACSGSGYAMALGADMIRAGEADTVVAGGFETYSRVALAAFNQVGALDPVSCRPFDAQRGGSVLGEGAAVVVLERADRARERGARIYATLVGSGWSCDAFHATGLDPDGTQIVRAMREALAEAGVTPDEVSFVVPHATGTKVSDATEARALRSVFGSRAEDIPLYCLKALTGHTGGASGGLGVIAAALFLHHGTMAPNLPVVHPDPQCPVNVPTVATSLAGRLGMVNTNAFGGNNMSLLLRGEPR